MPKIYRGKKKTKKMGLAWLLKTETCVACQGSGKSTSGRKCVPCRGTGKRQK